MPAETDTGPAGRALAHATARNAALGHENLGPLSARQGFLASRPPEHDLPAPHDAWVAAVDELPDLCRTLRVRQRLEELPVLDASAGSLQDRHLLRAASVLGLLAHAYSNVPMRKPDGLPEALVRPWLQTAERLGRPAFTLTNSDYIFDNWRLVDPHAADPMRVENMRPLNAIWDHPEMENFILVLVELLAQSAPLVGAAVRAQDACLRHDDESLCMELARMTEVIGRLTHESLPKISANSRSGDRRVDPVVWTKLFAMMPLPVVGAGEDVRNASGAETPYFHLMDVVLGRRLYDTQLGHEAMRFRENHPPHWRDFIAAVGEEPIAGYVYARGDRELSDLFAGLAEAYHGRYGLLARHRIKAFAYMDASFKTGRSSTVTGFSGLFEDRAWERIDASFETARLERERAAPALPRLANVLEVADLCPGVRRVVLDVGGLGMRFAPGDRCAVLPENEPALVERTLQALRASGDELVALTPGWIDALTLRAGRAPAARVPLRDVLTFGHIRPVPRATAKALHVLTGDDSLRAILDARTEDEWELGDLLDMLTASGLDPERLLQPPGDGDATLVCDLVPPLESRHYFVSSTATGARGLERIELSVKQLSYARAREQLGAQVPVSSVTGTGFSLPSNRSVPIVMLAEEIGVAPFTAFLQARSHAPNSHNLLLAEAPTEAELPHRERLLAHAASGEAEVFLCFSEDPSDPRRVADRLLEPPIATRLRELMRVTGAGGRTGGAGGRIYVCGNAPFARSMMDVVAEVLAVEGRPGRQIVSDLIVHRRYVQEVLPGSADGDTTGGRQIVASELAQHNDPSRGIWAAIGGRVYDLTAFAEEHPGGDKIIRSFAGMDASTTYRIVEHHRDPSVDALLSVFEIGTMRRLQFGGDTPLAGLFREWLRTLYVLVEIENAHRLDTSIMSEPLCRAERDGGPTATPYRLQFAIEAHARFLNQTVPIVCRRYGRLWQSTRGRCAAGGAAGALDDELESILTGRSASAARERCHEMERSLERGGASEDLERRLAELREADARHLQAAKTLLASGVQAFESHEAGVLSEGRDSLLGALRALPGLTSDYLAGVARAPAARVA